MDDALVRKYGTGDTERIWKVLILVLMDDALVLNADFEGNVYFITGLNPCFNG